MKGVSRPKHNILLAINRFCYLSAPQITRLVYGTKVLKYVREQIRELKEDGYLQAAYLPRTTPGGKSLAIYCLDNRGARYIRSLGMTPLSRSTTREWFFLSHTLSSNDLLISCHQLERLDSSFSLVTFYTERELKKRLVVIPDGWAHLQRVWPGRSTNSNHYLTFELDRGTVEQRAFRRKINALIRWLDDPKGYSSAFNAQGANIAFLTTDSLKRLDDMRRWTEEELRVTKQTDYGELFLFTCQQPDQIHPFHLFLNRIWWQPFRDTPTQLLEPPLIEAAPQSPVLLHS